MEFCFGKLAHSLELAEREAHCSFGQTKLKHAVVEPLVQVEIDFVGETTTNHALSAECIGPGVAVAAHIAGDVRSHNGNGLTPHIAVRFLVHVEPLHLAGLCGVFPFQIAYHFAHWNVFGGRLENTAAQRSFKASNNVLAVVAGASICPVVVELKAYLGAAAEREVVVHFQVQLVARFNR